MHKYIALGGQEPLARLPDAVRDAAVLHTVVLLFQ